MLFAREEAPAALLKNPLVLLKSEKTPVAVLKPPLVSLKRARRPVAVFWLPAVSWLSASKPVPVFQTPPVRLTSTPIPSPLLDPGMLPSVSGPTACAMGTSAKQANANAANAEWIIFVTVFMCLFPFILFLQDFAGPGCRKSSRIGKILTLVRGIRTARIGMRGVFCLSGKSRHFSYHGIHDGCIVDLAFRVFCFGEKRVCHCRGTYRGFSTKGIGDLLLRAP